jgi:hypothetical protein
MYNSDNDNFDKTNYSNEANFFKLCDFSVISRPGRTYYYNIPPPCIDRIIINEIS